MRLKIQTRLVSLTVATIFFVIGAGFLFGNPSPAPRSYHLLLNLERHLEVHGAFMCILAGLVLYTSSEYRTASRLALGLMGFYAALTGLLIAGSWWVEPIVWPAPWWYFLVAALCLILVRVSPPTVRRQRRVTDRGQRV